MFVRGILQEKKDKKPQLHWWCNGKRAPLECGRRWVQAMLRLNQRLKIRIMCQSGLTCVPLDFCFSVLV